MMLHDNFWEVSFKGLTHYNFRNFFVACAALCKLLTLPQLFRELDPALCLSWSKKLASSRTV